MPATAEVPSSVSFPIVGIGASAGGLEALEQFLSKVPERSGLAYVVIQHLDPTHRGALVELLQRSSPIPVTEAEDGLKVEPDHVYVIPPSKDLSVLHGTLHVLPQVSPRGFNLPIDFFFRSLAEDLRERSIGVLLSGMGSDGTLGLRAIKEKAGAAFVQSLGSAKFDGMPRSAIDAGLADVVAPADELPGKIFAYREHARYIVQPEAHLEEKAQSAIEKVFLLLRSQTGNDFSLYKRSTTYRRIERRMGLHQIDNIAHYVRFLRENTAEIELLSKELLIGVTTFFRDPVAWEHLKNDALPALLAARRTGSVLRAWVPGCSTGEEAYSLAMVFREVLEPIHPAKHLTLQIFATDLDREAIEKARHGLYPDSIAADVSPERLRRFFVQEERGYRVSKDIREMMIFAPQNIIMDPPFTRLDILSCRNLLIYLSSELQKKLIPLFHYSLNPGGVLFLGSAETTGSFTRLFAPLDGKARLYRRTEHSPGEMPVDFPSAYARHQGGQETPETERAVMERQAPVNLQALADRLLVQRFSPVLVLCNDKGDILYFSGRSAKYLEPPVGKANMNIHVMAREDLRFELSSAFSRAVREGGPVKISGAKVGTNGGAQHVELTIQKLTEPRELRGMVMVIIADVPAPSPSPSPAEGDAESRGLASARLAELEQELQRAREEVQTTREEMQTSQEELKSTNEELQSTNEELQSSNEELTTSKEEMQSLNEELQTVNHELQAKIDELSRSHNDLKNLLNSTEIATLFLDGELNVRRFTTPTAKIIKLIPGDAGRPVTDLTSGLQYPDLADDAREVLRTLVFKERQVPSHDGRWFTVRIMPYRTHENVIDGVVITFSDVSASRALESTLREQASQLRAIAESLPSLAWSCRPDGLCDFVNRQWVDYTGVPATEQLGLGWLEQVQPMDRERVREAWQAAVQSGAPFETELRIRRGDGAYRWFKAHAVPIRDANGAILKWYGTTTDVDDLKRAEGGLARLAAALESVREGFIAFDDAMAIAFFNPAAERMLGYKRHDVVGKKLSEAFPELGGSEFERRVNQALRDKTPASFELQFQLGGETYRARVYPQRSPEGVSAFFERNVKGEEQVR